MILYVDRFMTEPVRGKPGQEKTKEIVRERLLDVHMTPTVWKQVAKWMQDKVEWYEKTFAAIPEKPKGAKEKPRPHQIYG